MVKPTLQIAMWAVDRLIPYARNARIHSEKQVAQIAASIAEFGFVNPVLVDPNGSIIAGHGRVLAARKLGLTEIPVVVLAHLNENEKRAFILADNRIALNASWDEEMLRLELEALSKAGSNLENIGFDQEELDDLLAELSDQALEDPDEVPPAQPDVVTERGDLWTLGEHRLLCGDFTDRAQLDSVLGGGASDMIFTDLPYNTAYVGKTSKRMSIQNDNLGDQFGAFLSAACRAMLAVNSGAIYICMSSRELHNWCGDRDQGDVWFIDKPWANKEHPTMKPVELVERAITNSSRKGEVVLDPFGGAGSTLLAAERTGRRARIVEIDPQYADVIIRRWEKYSGRQALLEPDGQSFDEIAEQRRAAKQAGEEQPA